MHALSTMNGASAVLTRDAAASACAVRRSWCSRATTPVAAPLVDVLLAHGLDPIAVSGDEGDPLPDPGSAPLAILVGHDRLDRGARATAGSSRERRLDPPRRRGGDRRARHRPRRARPGAGASAERCSRRRVRCVAGPWWTRRSPTSSRAGRGSPGSTTSSRCRPAPSGSPTTGSGPRRSGSDATSACSFTPRRRRRWSPAGQARTTRRARSRPSSDLVTRDPTAAAVCTRRLLSSFIDGIQ